MVDLYLLTHRSLMFHQQTESIGQKVVLVTGIHPEHILQQVCTDATGFDDYTTLGGITPAPSSTGIIINPRTGIASTHGSPIQKEPMNVDRAVSSSSHPIIGEGTTVFTDMTMLKVLDR